MMQIASNEMGTAPSDSALGAETKEAFFRCLADAQRAMFAACSHVPPDVQKQIGVKVDDRQESFFALLQKLVLDGSQPVPKVAVPERDESWSPFVKFLSHPEIRPIHFVRLLLLLNGIVKASFGDDPYVFGRKFELLLNHYHQTHPYGLRELALAFKSVGLDETLIGRQQLKAWDHNPFAWEADAIWPYWAEHLDLLDQALQPTTDSWVANMRRNAFSIVASFPEPPRQFVDRLWSFAFGLKLDREPAQDALGREPGIANRVLEEITSGDPERRAIAAEWLGRIGDSATIEPLLRAVEREKEVEPRNAMEVALESLGAPLETLLNRDALYREAKDALAKGIPKELEWFPLVVLPPVRWSNSGELVPAEILQSWVIQSFKLKNPAPGPMLRRYCSQFVESERQALGRFVLETWIAQEGYTRKGPIALTCKGILAIAAACCGGEAAAAARTYLTNYPRERAGQCKALVQMLAWIDHPAAVQVLMSISSRFKPATIQEEARRLTLVLAQRKQWTVEQMADRAIPSAGLDDSGELRLSYGSRTFVARLNGQLEFLLADSAGKQIKSLPSARVSDDEMLARESKRTFAAAKKELKSVLQIQRDRLYEAMCIQRTWPLTDWETYLHRHPVMRLLCQRLVWVATRDGKELVLFRPLEDGSLTDTDDNLVTLTAESRIGLAHESTLSSEVGRDWQQHLADYNIEPLFPQFGIHEFKTSAALLEGSVLTDFEGHMIDAFTLRGRATKFGFSRGATVDGPWFNEYVKTFSTLGITAAIVFTGNTMPEANQRVALTELHFTRRNAKSVFESPVRIPLGEVPPVLLSECWNQMRQIAAGGHGFDPEWKKLVIV